MPAKSIPISDLEVGTVMSTHIRYFTGGLIAIPVDDGGYVVGPAGLAIDEPRYLGPFPFEDVCSLASQAGCYYVGCNEILASAGPERSEFWYPHIGNTGAAEHSADSWAGVAFQAEEAGDDDSSRIARHLSISMASASRRLRDVALLLNQQLEWAVRRQRASGSRYSNTAIHDLYLAVHSLLAEMCSARDYLSQLAAKRVGAKASTDNLARLQNWLSKAANADSREDALVKLIQGAAGTEADPGWLTQLSDLRNQITHRQPLGANPEAAALLYQQVATSSGSIPRIRLARFKRGQEVADGEDTFVMLLRYWLALERLSQDSVPWAPYGAEHPHFVEGK
ncbi:MULTISPECIES: hypothetical protein [Lysobacter]|uniref:hypothetical protein n=1 Tax=Lysobacter TaxID=68 RepID=UPI001F15B2DC|nr:MULTISPECIES: hypothetical protein [Lysobacter]UJB19197.1 hypothetical protein L1A79_23275 [Lysobacter capsici]UJQ27078.1 hypothetical protein L2D09_16610 [Lysobacter gummosus]